MLPSQLVALLSDSMEPCGMIVVVREPGFLLVPPSDYILCKSYFTKGSSSFIYPMLSASNSVSVFWKVPIHLKK